MSRLAGWTVLVTRQHDRAVAFREALEQEGAKVIEVPLIETLPPEDPAPLLAAVARLSEYDCISFTSVTTVRAVAAALGGRNLPESLKIATIGEDTRRAVREHFPGRHAGLTPPPGEQRAEGLAKTMAAAGVSSWRVLMPSSAIARDMLAKDLARRGAQCDVVTAYRTVTPADAPVRLAQALRSGVDVVAFASPSAVEGFVSSCPKDQPWPPAVVIGPTTEKAARAAGFEVAAVAAEAGSPGLVEAIAGLTRRR